jgi:hypothetical protein
VERADRGGADRDRDRPRRVHRHDQEVRRADHDPGPGRSVAERGVRVRGVPPAVTDGPYLEAKEYLGGFYLIDCEGKERAIELAAQIPDAKVEGMGVEVRQVMFSDGHLGM